MSWGLILNPCSAGLTTPLLYAPHMTCLPGCYWCSVHHCQHSSPGAKLVLILLAVSFTGTHVGMNADAIYLLQPGLNVAWLAGNALHAHEEPAEHLALYVMSTACRCKCIPCLCHICSTTHMLIHIAGVWLRRCCCTS